MMKYDAPKGARVKLKVARVEATPVQARQGAPHRSTYTITDADGGEHRWESSHIWYSRKEYIPTGEGDLYLTATVDGEWGKWDQIAHERTVVGYRLTRGRFSRDATQTLPPVAVEYKHW